MVCAMFDPAGEKEVDVTLWDVEYDNCYLQQRLTDLKTFASSPPPSATAGYKVKTGKEQRNTQS